MKRLTLILAAFCALGLLFAVASPAASKAPAKCKHGFHRVKRGKHVHCAKNRKISVEVEGTVSFETPVVTGPQGPAGATGPVGPAGPQGTPGTPAPTSSDAYNNITPESLIDNPVSLGYGATQTTQFGSQIAFAGAGGVTDPEVEVLLSVWSCEQGEWNAGCVTNPGTYFLAPLTLNVYAVGSENSVGALLASTSETVGMPYRPTSNCPTDATKFVAADGHCNHGAPTPVTFDLAGTLPHRVIVAVEFDPTGPLASLNVALEGPPSVGTNPLEAQEGVYWDSAWFGSGTFGLETESGEWQVGESQIALRVNP